MRNLVRRISLAVAAAVTFSWACAWAGAIYDPVLGKMRSDAPLPAQTGNNGKILTTDGTALSWAEAVGATTPTASSINALQHAITSHSFAGQDKLVANVTVVYPGASLFLRGKGDNGVASVIDSSEDQRTISSSGVTTANTRSKWPEYGTSLFFNGSNYAETPTAAELQFGTGDFMVGMWVYATSWTSNAQLLSCLSLYVGSPGWCIRYVSNTLRFTANFSGGWQIDATASWTPVENDWIWIAVSRTSGNIEWYVGDSRIGSPIAAAASTEGGTPLSLHIGTDGTAAGGNFYGYISDLVIIKGSNNGWTGATVAKPSGILYPLTGVAEIACTAAARALLDDDSAATMRQTLGAIKDVVEDTTPQLGGNLDGNTKTITNVSALTTTGPITAQATTSASLGSELITTTADQDMSGANNWSGTGWSVGSGLYSHTAGANAATLAGYAATNGAVYQVVMTVVTGTAGTLTIQYGGASASAIGQVAGTLTEYTVVLTATGTGGLVVTPNATWVGSIDNVSVKRITVSTTELALKASDGTTYGEVKSYPGGNGFGINTIQSNITGADLNGIGSYALSVNTSGSANAGFGSNSLANNTTGTGNSAFGHASSRYATYGSYNSSFGYYSLSHNITGSHNIALGYMAGRYISEGTSNANPVASVYLGSQCRALADGQSNQIVIGYDTTGLGSNSVVLGNSSITTTALRGNVGIGNTTPSAKLHLPAGSATASTAPIKLTSGTLLSTPEAGAIEYDGTNFHSTNATAIRAPIQTTAYAGMYVYDAATGITVTVTDQYHPVVTLLTGMVSGWTYQAGLLGAIASVAEGTVGDGKVTVTDVAHGLLTGEVVEITNSTDYNGKYVVTKLTDDTFEIAATWTQTRTGTWGRPSSLKAGTGASGAYLVQYQLTVDSAGTNREYKFEMVKNVTDDDKSAASRFIPGGSSWASVSGLSLMTIAAGDIVWLQAKPIANTDNLIIKHANIVITKI